MIELGKKSSIGLDLPLALGEDMPLALPMAVESNESAE